MVQVAFAGPEQQRRFTVALRVILLIPHFVVAVVLGLALYLIEVITWLAALVLGRAPEGLAGFIAGGVRYFTRLNAYLFLLTDRYPPYSLADTDYAVRVIVVPGRLGRWAVLFRVILVIPAFIVVSVVSGGVTLAMLFIWLIVLVSGSMPISVHQALAAVVRYQTRFYAYLGLLTATYPGELFGDRPGPAGYAPVAMTAHPGLAVPVPEPWQPWAPPAYPAPAERPAGPPAQEPPAYPPPPYPPLAIAPAYPQPAYPAPVYPPGGPVGSTPLADRLVLTTGARRVLVLFIVLGVVTRVGPFALGIPTGTSIRNTTSRISLDLAHDELTRAGNSFSDRMAQCPQVGEGGLPCRQAAATTFAGAFSTFASQLDGTYVPRSAQVDASRVAVDARTLASTLEYLASAPSATAYEDEVPQFRAEANSFDADYLILHHDLS